MPKLCRFLFLGSCFAFLFACSDDEDVSEAVEEPAPIVQAAAPTQPKMPSPRPVVAASTALPTVGATLNSQLPRTRLPISDSLTCGEYWVRRRAQCMTGHSAPLHT